MAGIDWDSGSQEALKKLVSAVRQSGHGTKIVLSVGTSPSCNRYDEILLNICALSPRLGGWSGCHWYSQAMSTTSNRAKLVNNLVEAVNTYGLDGVSSELCCAV